MDLSKYYTMSIQELDTLHTRLLMRLRKGTFAVYRCSCRNHCGDQVLSIDEREYNIKQGELREKVTTILSGREHVPNKLEAKAIRQQRAKHRN